MDEEGLELRRQLLQKIIAIQKEMLERNYELERLMKELQELDKNG